MSLNFIGNSHHLLSLGNSKNSEVAYDEEEKIDYYTHSAIDPCLAFGAFML